MEIKKIFILLVIFFSILSCSFSLGKDGAKGKDGLNGTSPTPRKETDSITIRK